MEPADKLVLESAVRLSIQFGIFDLPVFSEALARELIDRYTTLFGKQPEFWTDLASQLDHPELQAMIAYYRGIPAWRHRMGLDIQPVPGEPLVPDIDPETGRPRLPEVLEEAVEAPPAPVPLAQKPRLTLDPALVKRLRAPKARISGLAGWDKTDETLQELMNATPVSTKPDNVAQNRINAALRDIANEARRLTVKQVEVYLPYPDGAWQFSVIIGSWVHRVRADYDGIYIRILPLEIAKAS